MDVLTEKARALFERGSPPYYAFLDAMGGDVREAGSTPAAAYYAFQAMHARGGITAARVETFLAPP